MFRRECIANYVSQYVSQHLYRISCIAYYCIAYHVSHFMSRTSCIASLICKAMGGHGAPEATRGHGRPQEATRSHGRPRAEPHRPPKNIIPTKMGRPGSPERSVKKKTGDGGPRGATGGHGGPRRGTKKVLIPRPPPNILEDPYKLRLFGEYIYIYIIIY